MKKKMLVLVLAGIMAVMSLTGCKSVKTVDSEAVVMTVDGEEVTAGVANFYARYTQAQYESFYGAYMGDAMWETEAEEGVTYEEYVKNDVLKMVQTMILAEKHMADYGVELSDADKELVAKAAKEFDEANAQESKDKVSGDAATVERVMTLLAIGQRVQDAIYASVDTEVSDDEAAQKKMEYVFISYETTDADGNTVAMTDNQKADFKAMAEAMKAEVDAGKKLADVAASAEMEVKELTFDAESSALAPEVIKAADALAEGEVSEVIETETGAYILNLVSLFDREATDEKKDVILSQRQVDEYEKVCEAWLNAAEIEVNEDVWAMVDFSELSVSIKVEESTEETAE